MWKSISRRGMGASVLAGCFLVCASTQAALVSPETLRIAFIDFAFHPYMYGAGSEFANPAGKHVEWVNEAIEANRCKPRVEMVRLPVARMRMELGAGSVDMLVAGSDNAEIRAISVMPLRGGKPDPAMRVQNVEYGLYVLRGQTEVQWDGRNLTGPPDFKVGVSPLVAAGSYAREQGWKTELGQTPAGALRMLVGGRMPVVLTSYTAYMSLSEAERTKIQKLEPPVLSTDYYPVASKTFHATYAEFVEKFWRDLVKASRAD